MEKGSEPACNPLNREYRSLGWVPKWDAMTERDVIFSYVKLDDRKTKVDIILNYQSFL